MSRRGEGQRERLMDSLMDSPATIVDLARRLHIDPRCVTSVICLLLRDGLIQRVGEHNRAGTRGRPQSVFGMVRTRRAAAA